MKFVGLTKLLLKLHSMTCELNVHKELQQGLREVEWGNLVLQECILSVELQ